VDSNTDWLSSRVPITSSEDELEGIALGLLDAGQIVGHDTQCERKRQTLPTFSAVEQSPHIVVMRSFFYVKNGRMGLVHTRMSVEATHLMPNTIVCLLFLAVLKPATASQLTANGLSAECLVEAGQTIAVGTPIWIDFKITNNDKTDFTGLSPLIVDAGAISAPSANSPDIAAQAIARSTMDVPSASFTLPAGGSKTFRVLLNDVFPSIVAGVNSGWLLVPVADSSRHWFTLTAPYRLQVAASLTDEEKAAVDAATTATLDSNDWMTRYDVLRSLKYFPEDDAVAILHKSALDEISHNWAKDLVKSICDMARTPANNAALLDLSKVSDPAISVLATANLAK